MSLTVVPYVEVQRLWFSSFLSCCKNVIIYLFQPRHLKALVYHTKLCKTVEPIFLFRQNVWNGYRSNVCCIIVTLPKARVFTHICVWLNKTCYMNFHQTWWEERAWAKEGAITFWSRSQKKGDNCDVFVIFVTLWERAFDWITGLWSLGTAL